MIYYGTHRLTEHLAKGIQNAQLDGASKCIAIAAARVVTVNSRFKAVTEANDVGPGRAIGAKLFGNGRGGQLGQAAGRRFAGDVAARNALTPAGGAVGELTADEDVFAFGARGRRMLEWPLERQPDDTRGERSNPHEGLGYCGNRRRHRCRLRAAALAGDAVERRDDAILKVDAWLIAEHALCFGD